MSAKEIWYNETGPLAGLCPCCGVSAQLPVSCAKCFDAYVAEFHRSDVKIGLTEARGWYYRHGVRMRAEGKMPALKKAATPEPDPEAKIWTAAIWNSDGTHYGWCGGGVVVVPKIGYTHAKMDVMRKMCAPHLVGPVQLITEPPQPPTAPKHGLAQKPEPRVQPCCALPWCNKPASKHTDDDAIRCASYLTEREIIIGQYDKYMRELKCPSPMPGEPHGDIGSWPAHAAKRREDKLAALEAQFRALTFVPMPGDV